MNYEQIYQNLIEYRIKNKPQGYVERHHILPKSLGGKDENDNIVILTGREHWIAHLLLHKIYRKLQTNYACHIMAMRSEKRGITYIKNSRMYEAVRKEHAKHVSQTGKERLKEKNGSYETMWVCNNDLKKNRKIKKNDTIPEGWVKGRNKWKTKCRYCDSIFTPINREQYCSKECRRLDRISKTKKYNKSKIEKERKRKEEAEFLFNEFKNGNYKSVFDFVKNSNYNKTDSALRRLWKRYIPEYGKRKEQKEKKKEIIARSLFNEFKNGNYKSINDFVKNSNYNKTGPALRYLWKKYIPEYKENVIHGKPFQL